MPWSVFRLVLQLGMNFNAALPHTGYDFDTVPSLQPLNISSRDPHSWLALELAAADWLRAEGAGGCLCMYMRVYGQLLACWPGLRTCHCLMPDDEWVGLVQFPLTAVAASPLAVHVRINFCLMAGPCYAFPAAPSLSDIRHGRCLYAGDWQTNKTKPSLPSSFVCDYRPTGGISWRRKMRRCCCQTLIIELIAL